MTDWLTRERRSPVTDDDFKVLVRVNLEQLADNIEANRQRIESQSDCLSDLSHRVELVREEVRKHHEDSRELLDSYRFARQLRRVMVALVGGVTVIATALMHAHELGALAAKWWRQ